MRSFCLILNRFGRFTWYPNFISEGYFTQTVVPRELELTGPMTKRPSGQTWNYCEPVGNHPMMTELLLKRAREVAPDVSSRRNQLADRGTRHGFE